MVDVGCPWCRFNGGCPRQLSDEVCDFESLPFEKEVIIGRIQQESGWIQIHLAKSSGLNDNDFKNSLSECSDRFAAMKIMMGVLNTEFGMSREEMANIFSKSGGELRFVERMQLAIRLKMMQRERKGR